VSFASIMPGAGSFDLGMPSALFRRDTRRPRQKDPTINPRTPTATPTLPALAPVDNECDEDEDGALIVLAAEEAVVVVVVEGLGILS